MKRRHFLKKTGSGGLISLAAPSLLFTACQSGADKAGAAATSVETTETIAVVKKPFFKTSLAEWSLNKSIFGGKIDHLDFAATAKNEFGIEAVEYVNQFFADKAEDMDYLSEMKKRAADNGVKSLLIMIDREGMLGHPEAAERVKAVENHYKWVEAAKFLGCHSIRVNASRAEGTPEEVAKDAAESLAKLSEFAQPYGINVIVENHGTYSSDGEWLAGVIKSVGMDNCGTLPDFGNFWWDQSHEKSFDRYKGVKAMMPYAKAVSAKTHKFNESGEEVHTDYKKMLTIVKEAGYTGYLGIEYEGGGLPEIEGIKKTQALLLKYGSMV